MEWKKLEALVIKEVSNFDISDIEEFVKKAVFDINAVYNKYEEKDIFLTDQIFSVTIDETESNIFTVPFKAYIEDTFIMEVDDVEITGATYSISGNTLTVTGRSFAEDEVVDFSGTWSNLVSIDGNNLTLSERINEIYTITVNSIPCQCVAYSELETFTDYCYTRLSDNVIMFSADTIADIEATGLLQISGTWGIEYPVLTSDINIDEEMESVFLSGVLKNIFKSRRYFDADFYKIYSNTFDEQLNAISLKAISNIKTDNAEKRYSYL